MDPNHPAWKAPTVKTALFADSLWTAIQKAFASWTLQAFLPALAKDLKGSWGVESSHISAGNMMQVSSTLVEESGGKLSLYMGLDGAMKINVLGAYYAPGDRDVTERHKGTLDSFSGLHAAATLAREMNTTFKI